MFQADDDLKMFQADDDLKMFQAEDDVKMSWKIVKISWKTEDSGRCVLFFYY